MFLGIYIIQFKRFECCLVLNFNRIDAFMDFKELADGNSFRNQDADF